MEKSTYGGNSVTVSIPLIKGIFLCYMIFYVKYLQYIVKYTTLDIGFILLIPEKNIIPLYVYYEQNIFSSFMGIGLFMVSLGIVISPISPLYAATLTQSETIQLRYLEQQDKSNDRLIKNITNTIVSL